MPSTALEQYLLELINDARIDPLGDAARYIGSYTPLSSPQSNIQSALTYFGVSGSQLLAAYQALTPVQPVAFNDVLAGGARGHDNAMIAAAAQSHQLPGEADFGTRLANEGYSYRAAGENIYAYAEDMLYAQAGFMVDWGGSAATGGMQSPPGHRDNMMNAAYREAGAGVVTGSDPNHVVGPQVVTEDFGTTGTAGAFILGVAYSDTNHSNFYDVGEGLAGLVVSVGGASVTSSASGGYTLASALTGAQTVQLSGAGLSGTVSVRTALTNGAGGGVNVKLDVVDGATLNVSASAAITGAVSVVRALGVQALTLSLGDGVGRTLLGNGGGDTLTGGAGNDTIDGGSGNDAIDGGLGANTLDGGGGDNTAVFDFATSAASVSRAGAAWVVDAPGTHDVLTRFQHYQFTDRTLNALAVTFTSPDPLFDAGFYLAHNPDVAASGADPYQHYMTTGWKEGRDPGALFSTGYYVNGNPDVKAAGVNPLTHFETLGWKEGRNPDAWFDDRWYLAHNPDVAAAGGDPLLHFMAYGWHEGRDPSLLFSDSKYLAANPDVNAAGIDPLQHFLANGQSEGRPTFLTGGTLPADPLASAAYYDAQLGATLIPTGAAGAQQAAWSYDTIGWQRGLNPDAWFDTAYYLSHNPDVAAAHVDPLLHYEAYGWKEGRDPSAQFSTNKYLAAYGDVKAAGIDPLLHFVVNGQAEGRAAFGV